MTGKITARTRAIIWIAIFILISAVIFVYWQYQKYHPSTDDAYVQANIIHIAPQVSGPVAAVYVENNQLLKKGQKILDIDPAPFKIAVHASEAKLDLATQKIHALQNTVKQMQALIEERQSELDVATKDTHRILSLVKLGQETKKKGDDMRSQVKVAHAALLAAQSSLAEAQAKLGKIGKGNATLREAQSQLDKARLDLQHTHITAPADGKLVNFTTRKGTMLQTGVPVFDMVEQNDWWIKANFKETQLARIRKGDPVTIHIDTYPGHKFDGTVQSISAGSGAAFSILPPENATGNWVKVTQRVPVKILIKDISTDYPLHVGVSAVVTVDTTRKTK